MEEVYLIIAGIIFISFMLCLTIIWFLSVCGILATVDVGAGVPPIDEVVVAYKFARGPYKNAGELFSDVTIIAPDHKCIGIYYDDPKVIPKEKLRFIIGVILNEGKVKVEQELLDKMESAGLKIARLPAVEHCVKSSFPYSNALSIPIAVWKVYPALTKYIKENCLCAYPFLEIYEKDVINFMAPLSKQEDFFVPESRECVPEEYKKEGMGESFNDSTRGSPSMFSDMSDDSRLSRSISRFSSASRNVYDNYSDDDQDIDDTRDPDDIQDDEISSSFEVKPSKACTNLLEESGSEPVTDTSASIPETQDGTDPSLHDSGICSGRTSVVPADISTEKKQISEGDGNDSSSSFEEILMEETDSIPLPSDPKSAES